MTNTNLTTILLPAGIFHQDMTELIYIYFTFPLATGHHLYPFQMVRLESAPSIHLVLSVSSKLSCCISPLVLYMRCSYRKPQTNIATPELHPPPPLLLYQPLFSPLQCWSCWKWPLGWELFWTPWSRLCLRCVSYVLLHTYTHPFPAYLQDNQLT